MANVSRLHIVKVLLSPSWAEAFVATAFSVILTLLVIMPALYSQDSYGSLLNVDSASQNQLYQEFSTVAQSVNSSQLANSIALFLFWGFIGLVVYFIADAILRSISAATSFWLLTRYAGRQRAHLEVEGVTRLGIRVAAAAGLYVLYLGVFTQLLPYMLYLAHNSLDVSRIMAAVYLLEVIFLTLVVVHLSVILVRLLLLRVRIFSSPLDTV